MANSQHHIDNAGASPVARDVPLSASAPDRRPPAIRGGRVQQAASVDASAGVSHHRGGHQTPKKDQTVDPIDTWVSHHLSRCPEEPGQDTSGPAAAAETQPCSMGEARSAMTGGAVLRALCPSTHQQNDRRARVHRAGGHDPQEMTP